MVIKLCDGNDVIATVMMHCINNHICRLEIIIVDTIIGVAIGNCLVVAFVFFTS